MLPVPTVEELADFSGRPADSYGDFAASALRQATLLFAMLTRLTALPTDPDQAQLALFAILQMADRLYLEQPAAEVKASPFQSETIGSYSYSKSAQLAISTAESGKPTGLYWWDLALLLLTLPGQSKVAYGSIHTFDSDIVVDSDTGQRYLIGPADLTDSTFNTI